MSRLAPARTSPVCLGDSAALAAENPAVAIVAAIPMVSVSLVVVDCLAPPHLLRYDPSARRAGPAAPHERCGIDCAWNRIEKQVRTRTPRMIQADAPRRGRVRAAVSQTSAGDDDCGMSSHAALYAGHPSFSSRPLDICEFARYTDSA